MELAQNQILIELPDGTDKSIMYSTIAIANGWKEYNQKQTIEGVEVVGREQAEAKAQEFIAQDIYQGADTVQGKEDTYFVKYLSTIDEKNPVEAEEFGKNILVMKVKEEYVKAQLEIDTQAEKEELEKKQKAIVDNLQNISIKVS